ncbi:MAG TPA: hypothetical protein VLI90_17905, partial [Tepidisphaeraceae bacterium]|nr:hypothetical protein [Tepidisphaeraceae bacterium]
VALWRSHKAQFTREAFRRNAIASIPSWAFIVWTWYEMLTVGHLPAVWVVLASAALGYGATLVIWWRTRPKT